jgi:16S rRNA (uracil1498-N3)-methyltransferase
MARIFFIDSDNISGNLIAFSSDDNKHLLSLRKETGQSVTCVQEIDDGHVVKYGVLLNKHGKDFSGLIEEKEEVAIPDKTKIHILQCIPKLDKMELIIQKLSELGVYEIVPLFSRYTDIHDHIGDNKSSRWQKISRESAIQSGRLNLLKVHVPLQLKSYLQEMNSDSDKTIDIVLSELEIGRHLHDVEEKIKNPNTKDIFILIGAEGGFDPQEITFVQSIGFLSITLGETIMRTETPALVAVSIIQYLLGNL